MTVGIIGLGNIGCTLANHIANNGYDVLAWEYEADVVAEVNSNHTNSKFLPNIKLNKRLKATHDIAQVFRQSEIIINAIHTKYIRQTLQNCNNKISPNTLIVNVAKGIDANGITGCKMLEQIFPNNKVIMLAGPAIANEIARNNPTLIVLAGAANEQLIKIAHLFDNDFLRVRFSDDRTGIELGGILKNIYAIGMGIMRGKNITSINFLSVYLTLALEEMTKIGVALGAKEITFLSPAGLGDLLATSMSDNSHNRKMGYLLAKGYNIDQIQQQMKTIPEGYSTLRNILYIAEKLHVAMPIAQSIWLVINGKMDAQDFIINITRNFSLV
jgi:glycerol-3-phosphate dehydrogenase (NAD(P)+)